jgi:monoamine oxidase
MNSRRQFIKNTSLATGALVLASSRYNNFFIGTKPRVIIIGAGFAGLAAAYKLHQRKIDFVVLEARKRISGRVYSYPIDPAENLVVELGGEWVGNSHKRIKQLCKEFDLELFDNHLDTRLILEGKYFDMITLPNHSKFKWIIWTGGGILLIMVAMEKI